LNRRLELLLSIPGAVDRIRTALEQIKEAGWRVHEVRFDIPPEVVDLSLNCEQRISIDAPLADSAGTPNSAMQRTR